MSNLILDDVRTAEMCLHATGHPRYMHLEWDIVKTYDEFVEYITTKGVPNIISYDHDLADEHYAEGAHHVFTHFNYNNVTEKTGYHAVQWMIAYCVKNKIALPESYCHSANPYGKQMIESAIRQYYRTLYK